VSKPLVWMVVADTVLFLFVLDALCVAYLLRRNRGGGNAP